MRKILVLALLCSSLWGCGKKVAAKAPALNEPDNELYANASKELDHNHYERARLLLNTLINTYPDSEFLPQAKYAMAETFYREGTKSMLNQADTEFRDYITFFPTTDLADDAQLMIAMTHLRQIEKPDRDPSEARYAEAELKKLIRDYPNSCLLDEAKQKLREVQEVLAKNVSGIARQYYIKRVYPASANRYKEITEKYPDFSHLDDTLFYLAESLRRSDHDSESAQYYAEIVKNHPFSSRVALSKLRLTEMKLPVPEPNPVAIARSKGPAADRGILGRLVDTLHSNSDVSTSTAARSIRDVRKPGTGSDGATPCGIASNDAPGK
jgi:outer membrane protein assembly factor BamD